jgi:hypothetical protein
MKFKSDIEADPVIKTEKEIVFFDVEVFPNLFIVCWKKAGPGNKVVRMINPSAASIERLLDFNLIGFYNLNYDNQIIYAAHLGYTVEQLYQLSVDIIVNKSNNAKFAEATNISYTDVYDYSYTKQSLKKWEIELRITHKELGLPWNEPVPEELWDSVADYCCNDVIATEAVHNNNEADWIARQILAELAEMSPNTTTNNLVKKIVFRGDKNPQRQAVYTDLSEMFPGYEFKNGKSSYRGIDPGEGGYVYAVEGMYENVPVLDIASIHPTSIELLTLFGDLYTERYSSLKQARVLIKHKEFDKLKDILDGKLVPYVKDPSKIKNLDKALKLALNSAYGLTSASFDNAFKDPRNVDNIVAKRGALFMIDLQLEVEARGYKVIHIKTDSIKIANGDQKIIDFVIEFGQQYGYQFEHECTYKKFCLVNKAVYIAQTTKGEWEPTGSQFAHPYVLKKLFTKDTIEFYDLWETKSVQDADIVLDFNEGLKEDEHSYRFVGKIGSFIPVKERGGLVLRKQKKDNDYKYSSVSGTKGYRWMESYIVENQQDIVDYSYYNKLVDKAFETLNKYGDAEWFCNSETKEEPPWIGKCGIDNICDDCKFNDNGVICAKGFTVVPF